MTVAAKKYEYAPESPRPVHINRRDWLWPGASVLVIMIMIFVLRSGMTSSGSGLQMGWVESNTGSHWAAAYAYHDGYQQRTVNTDADPTTLQVEIVSSAGEIGMVVTDESGTILFQQEDIDTSAFEIEIQGKVTVKITGEEHKGSFSVSW